MVKNPASRIHECVRDLQAPVKLAVSGTPLENSLTELRALFAVVAPGLFPSARRFAEEYVRPIEQPPPGSATASAPGTRRPSPPSCGPSGSAGCGAASARSCCAAPRSRSRRDLPPKQEQVLAVDARAARTARSTTCGCSASGEAASACSRT